MLAVTALAAAALSGCQQTVKLDKTMQEPTITVAAVGEIDAAPNQANFSIQLQARGQQPDDASNTLNKQAAGLIQFLKDRGVPAKDIQTTQVQVSPQYERPGANRPQTPPKVVGYEASYAVGVTLDDLDKATQIMGAVTGQPGVARVNGPSLGFGDTNELEGQALAAAVKKARAKAEIIAAEAGLVVLEPLHIDGDEASNNGPRPMMAMRMAEASPEPMPIEAGQQTIRASVTVTFRARAK